LHYDDLKKKNIHNSKNLEILAEVVEDKENVIHHLNNQRDLLLENYVKGQKIALFIWQN
jgi:PII-like signaling protein